MKLKTTLTLVLLAAALFAFVKIYESKVPTTREAEEKEGRILGDFDRGVVKSVEIRNNDSTIELLRKDDSWRMEDPVRDRADSDAITRLMTTLELMKSKAQIDGKITDEQMRDFGIKNSRLRIRIEREGEDSLKLIIGNDTPIENQGYYVKLDGRDAVFVVNNDLKTQLGQGPEAFRDHKLINQSADEVEQVSIKTKAGEIEAVRDGEEWKLNKPFKARGDEEKLRDLIARITNARVQDFVSGEEGAGPGESAGSVALRFHGEKEPVVLTIGDKVEAPKPAADAPAGTPPPAPGVKVTVTGRNGIYVLNSAIGGILETRPNDIRDRRLIRLNPDIVDRFTITPAGGGPLTLIRKEEDWLVHDGGEHPANSAQALALLQTFHNQRVTEFVSDVASELEKYGLKNPELRITFSSYASENTAESQAGENEIATLSFGKIEGDKVYARLEDEPFIVAVGKGLLDQIPASAALWRSLSVLKVEPSSITGLEVTRGKSAPIALKREGDDWTSPAGKVLPGNVQSMANTLGNLRAVRWAGKPAPEYGLDNPSGKVVFKTEDGTARTLIIGARTPEQMYFAQLDGEPAVFVMSKPDYDTIEASLIESAAPAATATASPGEVPPAAAVPAEPAATPESE